MSTDHLILGGAVVVFVCALAYAAKGRKPTVKATLQNLAAPLAAFTAPTPVQAAAPTPPPPEASSATLFAEAMAAIERDGVRRAVEGIVDQFAASHAKDYKARVEGIVSPKDQPPPPPPV